MSFSKAKIRRFNEIHNDAPPPGAYHPTTDTKIRGSTSSDTKERLDDIRSNVGSIDSNRTRSSKNGVKVPSLTQFRTPKVPKKHVTPSNQRVHETKVKLPIEIKNSKYDASHELADLKVECANKNKTIHEYELYIQDMKGKIIEFENKIQELQEESEKREEQHKRDLQSTIKLESQDCEDELSKSNDNLEKSNANVSDVNQMELVEKIIQRDAEIEKLTKLVEQLQMTNETQESFNQSLQIELDRVECDLANSREELRNLKQLIREETGEMVKRRRRFRIIMNENRATVTALCQRLAESDAAFEKLQQELRNVRE